MSAVVFADALAKLELRVTGRARASVMKACKDNPMVETGGLVTGHYDDQLQVAVASGVWTPRDSQGTSHGFYRGREGVREHLQKLWDTPERRHYIGEWHSHPDAQPRPSDTDRQQMQRIAAMPSSQCRTPVLLIAYLHRRLTWRLSAWALTKRGRLVELSRAPRS